MASGGTLRCHNANRQLDYSACTFVSDFTCGDHTANAPEQCDTTNLTGATCQTLGYTGGTLACATNCTFDTSGCTPYFPSILEDAINFQKPGAPILHDPAHVGSLFYHQVSTTNFDIPFPGPFHESNLMNLVTDAARFSLNAIDPVSIADPVRVTFNANGVIRDAIQKGQTGVVSLEDMFRVLPLGVSPVEQTPGYPLVQFYVAAAELKAALEIGVGAGLQTDSFWLGISGARVEYDLSRPAFDPANPTTTGRITKIQLSAATATVGQEGVFEAGAALFDAAATPPFANNNPNRLIHIGTSLYITLYAEALGICPRDNTGAQVPMCKQCTTSADCIAAAPTCDTTQHRCVGGPPAAFARIAYAPVNQYVQPQELKEVLSLLNYIRKVPNSTIPRLYNTAVPRRMCCVGSACGTDRSCP
jgi:hypothetical protein